MDFCLFYHPRKQPVTESVFLSVTSCFIKKSQGKNSWLLQTILLGDRFHAADAIFAFCVFVGFGKDLDAVFDFAMPAEAFLTISELHHAGTAAGDDYVGAGAFDVLAFFVLNVHGQIIMSEAERASRTAATVWLGHFTEFNIWQIIQDLTWFLPYTHATTQVARVVIGDNLTRGV